MNVPLWLWFPWLFACGMLVSSWFTRGSRIIELEGRVAELESEEDDDGFSVEDMIRSGIVAPTSMVSPFAVASRAEIFGSMGATFGIMPPKPTCDRCGLEEHGGECIR